MLFRSPLLLGLRCFRASWKETYVTTRQRIATDNRVPHWSFFSYHSAEGGPEIGGSWLEHNADSFTYYRNMIDVVSPKGPGRVQVHPVRSVAITTDRYVVHPYLDRGLVFANHELEQNMGLIWSQFTDYESTVGWHAACDSAFQAMYTQMPEVVSSGNFLLELRETRALIPKIEKSLAKTVSGGFLNFSFGWKPLIGDLQDFSKLIRVIAARLDYLRGTYGRRTRVGYSTKIDFGHIGEEITYAPYIGRATIYKLVSHEAKFTSGGYLYHTLKLPYNEDTLLRAMIAGLGLNNPLKIAWNNLPYSFVVDWFAKIGGLLDRMAIPTFLEGEWTVSGVTTSLKETYIFQVIQHSTELDVKTVVGYVKANRYNRHVGLPVGVGTSLLLPDTKQQLLALALIHQRL